MAKIADLSITEAGNGCVPIFNMMEESATAEISCAQICSAAAVRKATR